MTEYEIVELVRELFQAAPWLVVGFALVVLTVSAILFRNFGGRFNDIRDIVTDLYASIRRSRDIINELEDNNRELRELIAEEAVVSAKAIEYVDRVESGVKKAITENKSALSIIDKIRSGGGS